jgi:phenylalanyl-tRNA synthetase beta chain
VKILYSWLGDFLDLPGPPDEVARMMSARGFAVEGLEPVGTNDAVIDVEVTANRPDCLSVCGFAREVATAYDLRLRQPSDAGAPTLEATPSPDLDVVIEDADLCPRYAGAVADVTIGPSPDWMQARLRAAGVRPTSNIVDVTNYVLLELGQPMHAFDYARLEGGRIRVRTARAGETLRTLDDKRRELSPEMLVIADEARAVALAGVMGGAESQVTGSTRTIVFESATFDPRSVRRTSKVLGVKTEASVRFERGVDPALPVVAMQRACELITRIGAGRARGSVVDCHPGSTRPVTVALRRQRIESVVGLRIPDEDVGRILGSLGFQLLMSREGWQVTVPTWRVDVTREADLIEEVARHYGFERIPVGFPHLTAAPVSIDPQIADARRLRAVLTGLGFSEAVTFGFTSASAAAAFETDQPSVAIRNPLSEAFAVLRPSLLPGLVESAGRNIRRGRHDVRLFEVGSRFRAGDGETRSLALVWSGAGRGEHWSEPRRDVDFYDATGLVSALVGAHDATVELEPTVVPFLVAGRSALVTVAPTGEASTTRRPAIGLVGLLAPAAGERLGLPAEAATYVAELAVDALVRLRRTSVRAAAPPRYPAVDRDISILVDDTTSSRVVRETIHALEVPILVAVREFDRYAGTGVPSGRLSLSLRLTFRAADRTLTDEEVQRAMDAVLGTLAERHGAVQR